MDPHFEIVIILTIGLGLASLLGYIAQKIKLPSILGYLLAGYIIGPHSPGFVANPVVAEQLAEVGIILMLFGVGLHFKFEDLIRVKSIAIPGALGQTFVASITGALLVYSMGWSLSAGIILGLAIGVASTVVLVRILTDYHLLATLEGHIAVGWLIVEDILTVAVLLMLPTLAAYFAGQQVSILGVMDTLMFVLIKFAILAYVMFTWGHKIVGFILTNIARMRSHELFTLSVLAMIFIIATGSTLIFGTSIALGAFIAGMVIGKTNVRHQAAANALPLKDIFAIIFFISVGMLFNPIAIGKNLDTFFGILGIILLIKPLAAFLIVLSYGLSFKVAITVALALAQIGEFSFILAEEAMGLKLLPEEGFDIIVACALFSISLNPLLFRFIDYLEKRKQRARPLKYIRAKLLTTTDHRLTEFFDFKKKDTKRAIVVGFGPVGQEVATSLKKMGITPIVIEQNIDTVTNIEMSQEFEILFGDAAMPRILEEAKISTARLLISTIPKFETTLEIINSARHLNPNIKILARANYVQEGNALEGLRVNYVCAEQDTIKSFVNKTRSVTYQVWGYTSI